MRAIRHAIYLDDEVQPGVSLVAPLFNIQVKAC